MAYIHLSHGALLEEETWPGGLVVLPSVVRFTTAVSVWGDDDELSECQINLGGCLHVGLKATLLVLIDS
jgi:hypothetical protein